MKYLSSYVSEPSLDEGERSIEISENLKIFYKERIKEVRKDDILMIGLMFDKLYYKKLAFYNLVIDPLTKLYNQKLIKKILDREVYLMKKNKNNLGILFIDLDNFKNVNTKYGHLAGTQVIKEVGKILKENSRKSDYVFRYGGDEYLIILPEAKKEKILEIAERMRMLIKDHDFKFEDQNIKITASLGAGSYSNKYKENKEFLQSADKALYKSKNKSKDCVTYIGDK